MEVAEQWARTPRPMAYIGKGRGARRSEGPENDRRHNGDQVGGLTYDLPAAHHRRPHSHSIPLLRLCANALCGVHYRGLKTHGTDSRPPSVCLTTLSCPPSPPPDCRTSLDTYIHISNKHNQREFLRFNFLRIKNILNEEMYQNKNDLLLIS